jgi:hypothetical protein
MLARAVTALALLLLLSAFGFAGPFTYDWTLGPLFVGSDGNNNALNFANTGPTAASGSTGSIKASLLSP